MNDGPTQATTTRITYVPEARQWDDYRGTVDDHGGNEQQGLRRRHERRGAPGPSPGW
jgi:hypothetical protein